MSQWQILTLISVFLLHYVSSCNEAVCGSIVSKCLLTQACKCDSKNTTCCRDCSVCLHPNYFECCDCVGLCPKQNESTVPLGKQSYIEDFDENMPELFQVLTEYSDPKDRWTSITFPIELDVTTPSSKNDIQYELIAESTEFAPPFKSNKTTLNCTVAFVLECISWSKCRTNCLSMGASSFRWFHNGCCECIGDTCINYGLSEAKCLHCSVDQEQAEQEDDNAIYEDDEAQEDFEDDSSYDDVN